MENQDISKRTVLVLLVLTLVVSVVGTWTVLSQPTTIYKTIELSGPQTGKVQLNIDPPRDQVQVLGDPETGRVALNIVEK